MCIQVYSKDTTMFFENLYEHICLDISRTQYNIDNVHTNLWNLNLL